MGGRDNKLSYEQAIESAYFDGIEDSMLGLKDMFEELFGKKWMLGEDFSAWELAGNDPDKPVELCQEIGDAIHKHFKDTIPNDPEVFDKEVWGDE